MKNKTLFPALVCACVLTVSAVQAQSISVDRLGEARAYEIGVLDATSGGFSETLWQGTSASRATDLISALPPSYESPVLRDMARAALLSSGTPPRAQDADDLQNFRKAKLLAITGLTDKASLQSLLGRMSAVSSDPHIKADMAMRLADRKEACQLADRVQEGRSEPFWAKLRSVCHALRGELAAAELTAGLLKTAGHEDEVFYTLLDNLLGISTNSVNATDLTSPLHRLMAVESETLQPSGVWAARLALESSLTAEERLRHLYAGADSLSDKDIRTVLSALMLDDTQSESVESFDLESALSAPEPLGIAQLYVLTRLNSNSENSRKAVTEILRRAKAAGAYDRFAEFLTPQIKRVSADDIPETDLPLFLQAAINRDDTNFMQAVYRALPDDNAMKMRVALMADALGNGFAYGALGDDIEARLEADGDTHMRAVRDSYIAVAMGARLSGEAPDRLLNGNRGNGRKANPAKILALKAAAQTGAKAETVLWAVHLLGEDKASALDDASFAAVLEALNRAGMSGFAGRLAAEDFMRSISG